MQNIDVLDNNINLQSTNIYRLSIQLCLNGFSFCIFDTTKEQYVCIKHFSFNNPIEEHLIDNIKRIISTETILKINFSNITILINSKEKILIPKEFFNKESINDFFTATNTLEPNKILGYNLENHSDNYIIYSIRKDLLKLFDTQFPKYKLICSIAPLIDYTLSKESDYKDVVVINRNDSYFFDAIVLKEGELTIVNTFAYKDDIDIVYYIINLIQKLNLDFSISKLVLSGDFKLEEISVVMLKKLFGKVEEIQVISDNRILRKYNLSSTFFANLLNTKLCV